MDTSDGFSVTWSDTSDLYASLIYEFVLKIDTTQWLITRQTKASTDGYVSYDAAYRYTIRNDTLPVLHKIGFDNDTTLKYGGYEFRNIVLNEPLEDSLFEDVSTRRIADNRSLHPDTRGNARTTVLLSADGKTSTLSPRGVLFDVRGRRRATGLLTPNGKRAAGMFIRHSVRTRER